jgi:hypothetical protein
MIPPCKSSLAEACTASSIDRSLREGLLSAAEELLNRDILGPLTGLRLAEVAGVKRHRLTHDNPDIGRSFKDRARQLNRHKREVERLQDELAKRKTRTTALVRENQELKGPPRGLRHSHR